MNIFKEVLQFNVDAGNPHSQKDLTDKQWDNELSMLQEEWGELFEAVMEPNDDPNPEVAAMIPREEKNRVEIADALGDIIYVAMGTMCKLGIDYHEVMREIVASNKTKYTDGKLVRNEQGKIQKGPNFQVPDLSFVSEPVNLEEMYLEQEQTYTDDPTDTL